MFTFHNMKSFANHHNFIVTNRFFAIWYISMKSGKKYLMFRLFSKVWYLLDHKDFKDFGKYL